MLKEINERTNEQIEGPRWDTFRLRMEFEVLLFLAPFVVVRKRDTGEKGSLLFRHYPRTYFSWVPDTQP